MDLQGTLRELVENYYFPRNSDIGSEETKRQYGFAIDNFEESLGRVAILTDLTDDQLVIMTTWMQRQRKEGGKLRFAVKTINERTGRLRAFWGFMFKRGHVSTFPTFAKLREPRRVPVAWKRHELDTLIAACGNVEGFIGPVFACNWWLSLHLCMWDCAERITAMLSSRWEWLSPGDDGRIWLTIPAEYRKGQVEDMTYRLSTESVAALELIRAPRRPLIWPFPYCKTELWTKYRKLRKAVGLATDRKSSFHRMRKSVASHFEAAGGNATKLLRHSSRKVTEQSYLDPTIVGEPQSADLLFRLKPPCEHG